jgi:hypothetical protein
VPAKALLLSTPSDKSTKKASCQLLNLKNQYSSGARGSRRHPSHPLTLARSTLASKARRQQHQGPHSTGWFGRQAINTARDPIISAGQSDLPMAIGCSRCSCRRMGAGRSRRLATSLATQALIPGTTGRHQMKSVPHLSSQDGSGRVQLEGEGPTRNRKVVGSNPTSRSRSPQLNGPIRG